MIDVYEPQFEVSIKNRSAGQSQQMIFKLVSFNGVAKDIVLSEIHQFNVKNLFHGVVGMDAYNRVVHTFRESFRDYIRFTEIPRDKFYASDAVVDYIAGNAEVMATIEIFAKCDKSGSALKIKSRLTAYEHKELIKVLVSPDIDVRRTLHVN